MTYIIRDAEERIVSFAEKAAGLVLAPGQRVEVSPLSFADYAARLVLSVDGVSGQTIAAPAGAGEVIVQVTCAPVELAVRQSVELDVNGLIELVLLVDGAGQLTLSCQAPGTFLIQPADRTLYPASGSSLLAVVVEEGREAPTGEKAPELAGVEKVESGLALRPSTERTAKTQSAADLALLQSGKASAADLAAILVHILTRLDPLA